MCVSWQVMLPLEPVPIYTPLVCVPSRYIHTYMKVLDHVMPREKISGALDSCFGLVGPHQQSISQLLSLASRVYKGCHERSMWFWTNEIHPHKACNIPLRHFAIIFGYEWYTNSKYLRGKALCLRHTLDSLLNEEFSLNSDGLLFVFGEMMIYLNVGNL